MSKRRALSTSRAEFKPDISAPESLPLTPPPVLPVPGDNVTSGMNKLTSEQMETLKAAIVDAGGPFWDRVLQMHGSTGTHSKGLAGMKPHHLWRATCESYCDYIDSIPEGQALPLWVQMASKAVSMNVGGSGIREKEVIQASYDAYGWTHEEDGALIQLLQQIQVPAWDLIYQEFAKRFGHTHRSKQDIESRAIVLHRYHSYFHPLNLPQGLDHLRTAEVSSFGLPWSIDWTEDEDAKLLDGISKVRGPYWGKILGMYGASGVNGNQLASKSETDLANRAREWWVAASGQQRKHIDTTVVDVLQYIQPKGFTTSGMPTSRGWSDEQDWILISELDLLKAPNYNEILIRHGVNGRISEKLAPKNYAQLRGRALKLHDFCIREKRTMPEGLQYAKRKD